MEAALSDTLGVTQPAPSNPQSLSLTAPSLAAADAVESELLHTYSKVDPFDVLILCVRVAVLTAVTLTVPIVLFPVSCWAGGGTQGAGGEVGLKGQLS